MDGAVGWRTEVSTRWVDVLPYRGRIYLHDSFRGYQVLDRETGAVLFSIGAWRPSVLSG